MREFPGEFPDILIGRLDGKRFTVKSIKDDGLCQSCNKNDAEVSFNVGQGMNHLCGDCFKKMVASFTQFIDEKNKEGTK